MKIISWNVNGLRSAIRQGFMEWFVTTAPDILCLQEIKAKGFQLPLDEFEENGIEPKKLSKMVKKLKKAIYKIS